MGFLPVPHTPDESRRRLLLGKAGLACSGTRIDGSALLVHEAVEFAAPGRRLGEGEKSLAGIFLSRCEWQDRSKRNTAGWEESVGNVEQSDEVFRKLMIQG